MMLFYLKGREENDWEERKGRVLSKTDDDEQRFSFFIDPRKHEHDYLRGRHMGLMDQ